MLPIIQQQSHRSNKKQSKRRKIKTGPCCFLSRSGKAPPCKHEQARLRRSIQRNNVQTPVTPQSNLSSSYTSSHSSTRKRQRRTPQRQKQNQKQKQRPRKSPERARRRPLSTFEFGKQTARAKEHSFVRNIINTQRQRPKTPTWEMKNWPPPPPSVIKKRKKRKQQQQQQQQQQRQQQQRLYAYQDEEDDLDDQHYQDYQDDAYQNESEYDERPPSQTKEYDHTMEELISINIKLDEMKTAVRNLIIDSSTTSSIMITEQPNGLKSSNTSLRGTLPPTSIMGIEGLPLGIAMAIQKFETIQQLTSRVASGMITNNNNSVKLFAGHQGQRSPVPGEYPAADLYWDGTPIVPRNVGLALSPTHLRSPSISILAKPLIKTAENWITTMSAAALTMRELSRLDRHINNTARSTSLQDDPLIVKELILLHHRVVESGRKLKACIDGENGAVPPLHYTARLTYSTTIAIETSEKKLDQIRQVLWSSTNSHYLFVNARSIQCCWRGYWSRKENGTFAEQWIIHSRATLRIQILFRKRQFKRRCLQRQKLTLKALQKKRDASVVRLQMYTRSKIARRLVDEKRLRQHASKYIGKWWRTLGIFKMIRNFVRERNQSASMIQNSLYRTRVAREKVQWLRDAKKRRARMKQHMQNEHDGVFARRIQAIIRQRKATKYVKKIRTERIFKATTNIQRWVRGKRERKIWHQKLTSVIQIQSFWRMYTLYKKLHPILLQRKISMVKIQSVARSKMANKVIERKRKAREFRQEKIRIANEKAIQIQLEQEKREAFKLEQLRKHQEEQARQAFIIAAKKEQKEQEERQQKILEKERLAELQRKEIEKQQNIKEERIRQEKRAAAKQTVIDAAAKADAERQRQEDIARQAFIVAAQKEEQKQKEAEDMEQQIAEQLRKTQQEEDDKLKAEAQLEKEKEVATDNARKMEEERQQVEQAAAAAAKDNAEKERQLNAKRAKEAARLADEQLKLAQALQAAKEEKKKIQKEKEAKEQAAKEIARQKEIQENVKAEEIAQELEAAATEFAAAEKERKQREQENERLRIDQERKTQALKLKQEKDAEDAKKQKAAQEKLKQEKLDQETAAKNESARLVKLQIEAEQKAKDDKHQREMEAVAKAKVLAEAKAKAQADADRKTTAQTQQSINDEEEDLLKLRADRVKGLQAALEYAEDIDTVQGILTVVPSEEYFSDVRKQAEAKLRKLQEGSLSLSVKNDNDTNNKDNDNDAIFKKLINNNTN